jgi:hypothetical protein
MFRYWLCFGLCLMAAGMQQVSHAGVLTYSPGFGGTFDPTSPSTFTFTNFANDTISSSATYTHSRLQFRWGGTTPYPGAFNVTNLSLANPGTTTPMGDVSFLADTAAGVLRSPTSFAELSVPFKLVDLPGITATFTIPTLNVADGWYLESRLQLINNISSPLDGDVNYSAWQRATASTAVPEPGSAVFLAGAAAAGYLRRRRRQSKEKAAARATI